MLEADYLWDVPDSVVAIWEELEDWAIEDIIYRIVRMDELNQAGIGGAAVYRMELLQRMGMDMNNVIAEISKYTKKSEKELKELFLDAGARTLENDSKVLLEHGIKTAMLNSNEWAKQILQMMYKKTNGELRNFTGTFAQNYQRIVHECFDKAFVETATGMRSYTEAVGQAIDDLGKMGITMVSYKNNRKDTVETAVRRAVLTGINQAAMQISVENCKKLGVEYVIVSSHLGARVSEDKVANHAGWQGKVFKIEGSDETAPNLLEETGFPKNPLGLGGYNCRHNMFPYFPGDENPFKQFGKEENEKAYRISQEQRAKERAIRKRKRELMALQKGIDATDNEQLKFDLQQRYDKTAHKLQLQNKNYHDFCEEHKVKTQTERMKTAKWDRAQARMAGAGAQRYRNSLLAGNVKASYRYRDSEDIFKTYMYPRNDGKQTDIVKPHNIIKDMQKSEVGRAAYKYLKDDNVEVELLYNVDNPNGFLGEYDPYTDSIFVYADITKSITETVKTVIHEATHRRLGSTGTRKEEVRCFIEEERHTKPQLTYADIKRIIKMVNSIEVYKELPWR